VGGALETVKVLITYLSIGYKFFSIENACFSHFSLKNGKNRQNLNFK